MLSYLHVSYTHNHYFFKTGYDYVLELWIQHVVLTFEKYVILKLLKFLFREYKQKV